MSVEGLMLDAGLDVDMTEFESKCYGMSEADIRKQYMKSLTARVSGLEMVVMGILSDCQEILDMTAGSRTAPHAANIVCKKMNVAKFILSEMMDLK